MLRIERTSDGQGRVFRLVGELDVLATRQFERAVVGPAGDGGDLTLDLVDLSRCDALGIRSLSVLARRARLAGGRVILRSPREPVLRMLDAADLEFLALAPALED